MSQLPKVKQHRLHNEGSTTLMLSGATLLVVAALDYWLLFERCPLAFYIILDANLYRRNRECGRGSCRW